MVEALAVIVSALIGAAATYLTARVRSRSRREMSGRERLEQWLAELPELRTLIEEDDALKRRLAEQLEDIVPRLRPGVSVVYGDRDKLRGDGAA